MDSYQNIIKSGAQSIQQKATKEDSIGEPAGASNRENPGQSRCPFRWGSHVINQVSTDKNYSIKLSAHSVQQKWTSKSELANKSELADWNSPLRKSSLPYQW